MKQIGKTIDHKVPILKEDKELVSMLADGMKGNQIAEKLRITENKLASELMILRAKFNCKNSLNLVAYFLRNKIID